jgi:tetratricopeptide (TPR) repeat protein
MNNLLETPCPRCSQNIAAERFEAEVVVCNHCGFTADAFTTQTQNQIERQYIKTAIITGIFIVAAFIQVVEWDQYFLSIIPLKMKQITSLASSDDLRKIVQICEARMHHSCVETALAELSVKEPNNSDIMYDLGEIRRKTGHTAAAVDAYKGHFARGGNSAEAAYQLARIMEFNGQYDEAQNYYTRALLAKPDVLQVTVIQSYVNMLIKLGKATDARAIIADVRKKNGPSAQYFMAKEYDSLTH